MTELIKQLKEEIESKKSALEANIQSKDELLNDFRAVGIDSADSDIFADNYARIWKNNIALTNSITDLEQALFYISRAININD